MVQHNAEVEGCSVVEVEHNFVVGEADAVVVEVLGMLVVGLVVGNLWVVVEQVDAEE